MSAIEIHSALRSRVVFFYGIVGFGVLTLFGGLGYRQLFSSEAFVSRERIQNQRRILIPGPRGEIYDREERILVANRPRFSAVLYFSDPRLRQEIRTTEIRLFRQYRDKKIEKPSEGFAPRARAMVVQRYLDMCARILGRTESVNARQLERHFAQNPLLPFPVIQELSPSEFAVLVEQVPVGSPLQIFASTMRHYPYGPAAAHTLGYVKPTFDLAGESLPGADLKTFPGRGTFGDAGLERTFDHLLQGQTGSEIWIVDHNGIKANMVENLPPVTGKPLYTSIDVDIQSAGEEAFADREGALVALDVRTGEVLALVSKPDYDLNDFTPGISHETWQRVLDQEALLNRATQGLYPPGSPFKLITASAALRTGAITPETKFECHRHFRIKPFVCHSRVGHGVVDLRDAIKKSCNIYFYEAALAAGPTALAEEARRFGLDRPTGIELAEERRMIVPTPQWKRDRFNEGWTAGDTLNMAIGQGALVVTPLQMACFTASLARGETGTTPTLVRRRSGSFNIGLENQSHGLSPRDRTAILEGMDRSVQDRGTGHFAAIPGVRIAGKTGTAQKDTERGKLELAWFIGFAPIENPRIAIAVIVVGDAPDTDNAGGQVAAPRAKKVLEAYFNKYPVQRSESPKLATR